MGVDWRINIDQAWMDISYRSAIQGNLDPVALFAPLPRAAHQGSRAAEAHGHAAGPHLQSRPRHSAGNAGGEREGGGGDGAGISPMKHRRSSCSPTERRNGSRMSRVPLVRAGRQAGISARIVEEVRHRYAAIGGSFPLLRWTRAQAEALERRLGIPVFFGMRNWHPFIRETMEQVREVGTAPGGDLSRAAIFRTERGPVHQADRRGQTRSRRDGRDPVGQELPRRAAPDRSFRREAARPAGKAVRGV